MKYVHWICLTAQMLDENLLVAWSEKDFKFTIMIKNVLHRKKSDKYFKNQIFGVGFTIEDACYHYFMKSKGDFLVHTISNKEIEVI